MNEATTYEIVIRGRASERLLARLRDDFTIEPTLDGHTRLVGGVRDAAHLHGVINQLTALALEIVTLAAAAPTTPSTPPTPSKETP